MQSSQLEKPELLHPRAMEVFHNLERRACVPILGLGLRTLISGTSKDIHMHIPTMVSHVLKFPFFLGMLHMKEPCSHHWAVTFNPSDSGGIGRHEFEDSPDIH